LVTIKSFKPINQVLNYGATTPIRMTISITTLNITTLNIKTLSITTLSIMTIRRTTFSITIKKTRHSHEIQNNDSVVILSVIMLSVFMLNVVTPNVVASTFQWTAL
jgi:hypothetical protein